jgi:7-cyano-7-deazaguanine reductase
MFPDFEKALIQGSCIFNHTHHKSMTTQPSKDLETFPNPQPGRDFTIRIDIPEFTCLCPKTGQPDFANIQIEYVPADVCVELKALKLYMWTFRERGAFHEAVTNEILNDIVAVTQPNFMRVRAEFNVRGGIYTTVVVEHRNPAWQAPALVNLP